jgi:hypothetical protein
VNRSQIDARLLTGKKCINNLKNWVFKKGRETTESHECIHKKRI